MPPESTHVYLIDGSPHGVAIENAGDARTGEDVVLSTPENDATWAQPWGDAGFAVLELFSDDELEGIRTTVAATLVSILDDLGIAASGFTLEQYHRFVDDDQHAQVTQRTRDLVQRAVAFDVDDLHARLGERLGMHLTDRIAELDLDLHIVLRVNRPGSGDFNPVHKDIYEAVDHLGIAPALMNFWIPIAGVGPLSTLPLAPGSHRLSEREILRTRAGTVVDGRRYHVNSVLEWGGSRALERATIEHGQVLVFSSHLVHGLALNLQPETTRVAMELRLAPG